jgi:hypothetical protein
LRGIKYGEIKMGIKAKVVIEDLNGGWEEGEGEVYSKSPIQNGWLSFKLLPWSCQSIRLGNNKMTDI